MLIGSWRRPGQQWDLELENKVRYTGARDPYHYTPGTYRLLDEHRLHFVFETGRVGTFTIQTLSATELRLQFDKGQLEFTRFDPEAALKRWGDRRYVDGQFLGAPPPGPHPSALELKRRADEEAARAAAKRDREMGKVVERLIEGQITGQIEGPPRQATRTPPAAGRSDNGVFRDPATGVSWTTTDNGRDINWPDAKAHCGQLRLDNRPDWRLPTMEELETVWIAPKPGEVIIDIPYTVTPEGDVKRRPQRPDRYTSGKPLIKPPIHVTSYGLWSSTVRDGHALVLGLVRGEQDWLPFRNSMTLRALCVHR